MTVSIRRLRLRVTGGVAVEPHRLAAQIADALAEAPPRPACGNAPPRVTLRVGTGSDATSPDRAVARAVAAAIARRMAGD